MATGPPFGASTGRSGGWGESLPARHFFIPLEAVMDLELRHYHNVQDDRAVFILRFVIRPSRDEIWYPAHFGMPYLAAFWERHGLGAFSPDQHLQKRHEQPFNNVERAQAFERDLVASCKADLWYWQQSEGWEKQEDGSTTLTPEHYPSEGEAGT